MTPDVTVIGGGVIGLAIAWRAAQRGMTVTLLDPAPGSGASHAAAGMLAPINESHFGEDRLRGLLLASAARWPSFAEELTEATGQDIGYRTDGTLVVALTDDDKRELDRAWAYHTSLGLPALPLRPRQARTLEPALSPRIRAAVSTPDDHQVDPRRLVTALRAAALAAGVRIDHRRVWRLDEITAGQIVVAAGCASADLTGLPVRPVKGQILRLRAPDGSPGFSRVLRGFVDGRIVYLVPRLDGEVVVGATAEERGHDVTVTAGAVYELLRAATDLVPELTEYQLVEAIAGLRPGTPDNAPLLGRLDDRVVVATGHFRHGVLLTPVTADALAHVLTKGDIPEVIADFDPRRFPASQPRKVAGPLKEEEGDEDPTQR